MPEVPVEAAPAMTRVMVVPGIFPADPSAPIFSGLLIAGILWMAIVGAATAAMTLDVWPGYLEAIYSRLLIFTGVMLVVGALFAVIGWLIGRQPTARREKAKKAPA